MTLAGCRLGWDRWSASSHKLNPTFTNPLLSCTLVCPLACCLVAVRGSPPPDVLPLALAVDDREDVWDAASQPALLQVVAFHPHKETAAVVHRAGGDEAIAAAEESEKELLRVRDVLIRVRSEVYQDLMEVSVGRGGGRV